MSSLAFFKDKNNRKHYGLLLRGMVYYYIVIPALILFVTRSLYFFFFIYIQPLLCMTYFLAFMNFGFHAFIEFDDNGKHINCINSTMIIEGDDDYFGEDDHMTHHYSTKTYWRDLPQYQRTKVKEFAYYHASVFRGLSIVELSFFLLLKQWDMLAAKYVDYSGKMTKEEIKALLKVRAHRIEA